MTWAATLQPWLWALNVGLEFLILYSLARRGTWRRFKFLSAYLAISLVQSGLTFLTYRIWGFTSKQAIVIYWGSQTLVLLARSFAVVEVCKDTLQAFRGIWALSWRLLASVAAMVLLYAAMDTSENMSGLFTLVLSSQRGLELAAALVLFTFLLVVHYYRIPQDGAVKALAFGFCFYSTIIVLNNTVFVHLAGDFLDVWNLVQISAYFGVQAVWWSALRRALPKQEPAPQLIHQGVYEQLSPEINYRLRLLNDRLMEMLSLEG